MIPENIKTIIDFTLGDGWIGWREGSKNAIMRIEHAEKQMEYAKHKEDILRQYGYSIRSGLFTSTTKKNNGRKYYRVDLNQHSDLSTAYKWVYNKKRKAIDKSLLKYLDIKTLAYLFMDDGCCKLIKYNQKNDCRYVYDIPKIGTYKLSINNFNPEEAEMLSKWIYEVSGVIARVKCYPSYNYTPVLEITGEKNKDLFRDTIKPFIIPSMQYKINHPHNFNNSSYTIVPRDIVQRKRLSESDSTEYATV